MGSSPLANYLKTGRRRAGLSQKEIAFLLGTKSATEISRYEHGRQTPQLRKLLAYEYLFQTPIRKLYDGTSVEVEHKTKKRILLLIKQLLNSGGKRSVKRKLEMLENCLGGQSADVRAA